MDKQFFLFNNQSLKTNFVIYLIINSVNYLKIFEILTNSIEIQIS